jgi:ribosome-associated heat shock protein Hsp15
VRADRWLWAARFFKTRTQAGKACELGRVEANGVRAKPAREVRVGDVLKVRNEGGEWEVEVLGLSEMRGPAGVAQGLYRETEAGRERRLAAAGKVKEGLWESGRLSKRERREREWIWGRG